MNIEETVELIKPIDGWLSSHEGYFLYKAAKEEKGRGEVVEIGNWKGKSTICLASGLNKKEKVIAIDPHKGKFSGGKASPTYKEFLKNLASAHVLDKVKPILATSEDAAKKWKNPIRLLFIDGLHDYKHTFQDFTLWEPFVVQNGVIAFHDAFCGHIGPKKVVLDEIFPSKNYSDIGVVGSIIYARKNEARTFLEKFFKHKNIYIIQFAFFLDKCTFSPGVKFFLIHRILKLLLLNKYTNKLVF